MEHDYTTLLWDESADIADFLNDLDDTDFDTDSLCDGWRVRDVASHMILGHSTSMPRMIGLMARFGFNVPKASRVGSRDYGSEHSPDQIRTAWSQVVDGHVMKGIAAALPTKEGFADHVIHHQDMRRPVGQARTIPPERLTAALDVLPSIGGFLKSKQRMKGLRWSATDIDWTWGQGPSVEGEAEALILAAGGRQVALADLSGEGMDTLRSRFS